MVLSLGRVAQWTAAGQCSNPLRSRACPFVEQEPRAGGSYEVVAARRRSCRVWTQPSPRRCSPWRQCSNPAGPVLEPRPRRGLERAARASEARRAGGAVRAPRSGAGAPTPSSGGGGGRRCGAGGRGAPLATKNHPMTPPQGRNRGKIAFGGRAAAGTRSRSTQVDLARKNTEMTPGAKNGPKPLFFPKGYFGFFAENEGFRRGK
jgi:hypothetical protein